MKAIVITALAVAGSGWGVSEYLNQSQSQVERTIPAVRDGLVEVRVPDGRIVVEGWGRRELKVVGALPTGPEGLEVREAGDHSGVRFVPDLDAETEVDLKIYVPAMSTLDIQTDGASVEIDGVTGFVRVESGSGNVSIHGDPLGILAHSDRGDIDISAERAPGIAHSEKGTVTLRGGAREVIATGDELERLQRDWRDCNRRSVRRTRDCLTERWDEDDFEDLARQIGHLAQRVVDNVDVDGFIDFDRRDDGFGFDLSADVSFDAEELEELMSDLEDVFDEIEFEIGAGMQVLGETLKDLGEELHEHGRRHRR